MPILTTAITTFILLVLIGIIVGLFFNRGARSWLGRRVAQATGAGDVTYGSFWASTSALSSSCCPACCSTSRPSRAQR